MRWMAAVVMLGAAPMGFGLEFPSLAERLDPNMAVAAPDGALVWYDALALGLEAQGWTDLQHPYDRLPETAQGLVPDPVWSLSRQSAGLCMRFLTDSPTVSARWTLRSERLALNHMPATGVSGLDLYARDSTRRWRWVGVGRPTGITNEAVLAGSTPGGQQEYLIYLPLYNGIEKLELGVTPGATLAKALAYPPERAKPIVMYGTSIVQGGCASRPGMAHTAILGRTLDRPVINLGFSGNGKMEPALAELMAEIEAAAYVIDCAPNMDAELIAERAAAFVRLLRERAAGAPPVILVENIVYQHGWFAADARQNYASKNTALRAAYDTLKLEGVSGLYYVPAGNLLGTDGEGTVDGTHPTDVGFLRLAAALAPVVRDAIAE